MTRTRRVGATDDAGFTLVEVVVAMFVLALVILSIIFVQASALTSNADSGARVQATAFANEAMERMRAIPWNVLQRGLAGEFLTASGGDDLVTGGELTVNGKTYTLIVAPPSPGPNHQDLSNPWPPLFDSTGSNRSDAVDVAGNGNEYVIRSYVTEDLTGAEGAVGLVVVAQWEKRTAPGANYVVLESTAFAPSAGCGDPNDAPFLASCQAVFTSAASAGNVVVSLTASADDGTGTVVDAPLVPAGNKYSMLVTTSRQSASTSTQQVTGMDASVLLGGVIVDDDDATTDPAAIAGWQTGFGRYDAKATDDTSSAASAPATAGTSPITASDGTITESGSVFTVSGRADDSRSGSVLATVAGGCTTGGAAVPADRPCGHGEMGDTSGTAPADVVLGLGSADLTLSRVSMETSAAWAARFAALTPGNSTTGCETSSGLGCSSAGARQSVGSLTVGDIAGDWTDGHAPDGLVVVTGYVDTIRAERGSAETAVDPLISRSGTVRYWNGAAYADVASLTAGASGTYSVAPVSFTNADVTVTASGTVVVGAAASTTEGAAPCQSPACAATGAQGSISIAIVYTITPTDGTPYDLAVSTVINGSQASASFKAAPDAT